MVFRVKLRSSFLSLQRSFLLKFLWIRKDFGSEKILVIVIHHYWSYPHPPPCHNVSYFGLPPPTPNLYDIINEQPLNNCLLCYQLFATLYNVQPVIIWSIISTHAKYSLQNIYVLFSGPNLWHCFLYICKRFFPIK